MRCFAECETRAVMMLQELDRVTKTIRVLVSSLNNTRKDVRVRVWQSKRIHSRRKLTDPLHLHLPQHSPRENRWLRISQEDRVYRIELRDSSNRHKRNPETVRRQRWLRALQSCWRGFVSVPFSQQAACHHHLLSGGAEQCPSSLISSD